MKYFFKTLILIPVIGSLIFFSLIIFLIYIVPVSDNSYSLAHIDKMNMLETKNKKIVIFGGSNVAFGINSELIREEFSDYKVVNVGTHASIGMRYPLKEIKEKLNKKDILIISPEYAQFQGGYGGTPLIEICLYRKSFKNIEIEELLNGIKNIKELFLNGINTRVSSKLYGRGFVYDRRGFNKNGDYVEHYKFKIENDIKPQCFEISKIDNSILKFFYEIQEELNKKEVKVLFLPPVYQETSGKLSVKSIEKICNEMKKNETPFLSKPEIYFLNDKYFYDTVNHLNEEGGKIRTNKLINDLKNLIEQ